MHIEKLMLVGCFLCKKPFKDNDSVCTISSRVFNEANFEFTVVLVNHDLGWSDTIGTTDYLTIKKEINFHSSCFVKIAGEDYVP